MKTGISSGQGEKLAKLIYEDTSSIGNRGRSERKIPLFGNGYSMESKNAGGSEKSPLATLPHLCIPT